MAQRYARIQLENSQSNQGTTAGVFGTSWDLPAQEFAMQPNVAPLDRGDEQRGVDSPLSLATNEYAPTGQLVMRTYVNYIGAILMLLFDTCTTTAGNGVITDPDAATIPTGAYRHVFTKGSSVSGTPKSARVTSSYGTEFFTSRGVTCSELAFALGAEGIIATATLLANYMERIADPSITPAYDAFSILPFRRRNTTLSWGVGAAITEDVSFSMAQALEAFRSLQIASGWPTSTERANSPEGFLRLTGDITRRAVDDSDWDALIAATGFAVTVKMASEQNIGATAYPYSMWVQAPLCQYADGSIEALKNQPRHQQTLSWRAAYSESDTYDFKVTLVNGVAAYHA